MVNEILVVKVNNGFVIKLQNGEMFVTDKLPQVFKTIKAIFSPQDKADVAQ